MMCIWAPYLVFCFCLSKGSDIESIGDALTKRGGRVQTIIINGRPMVESVQFNVHKWSNEERMEVGRLLGQLRALKRLQVFRCKVDDSFLAEIARIKGLEMLDISSTRIESMGLRRIGSLMCLKSLTLFQTEITSMESICQNERLAELDVSYNPIKDDGFSFVKGIRSLEHLNATRIDISDVSLEYLLSLTHLRVLNLSCRRLTDAGLRKLRKLEALEELHLDGTQLRDAGLEHLSSLPRLKKIVVDGTMVTSAGVASVRNAKPELEVVYTLE